MQKKVEEAISLLSAEFKKHFNDFHGMYLYGVHLDGKTHKNDDIELVAIFDAEDKYKRELIWPVVGKVETELDVFIDLIPTTMDDLEKDEELHEVIIKTGVFFNIEGSTQLA